MDRDRDRERERERERDRGPYDLSTKKHKHERSSGHRGERRERSRSYERERERERGHKSKHHSSSGHSGHSRHRRWRTTGESRTGGHRCSFTLTSHVISALDTVHCLLEVHLILHVQNGSVKNNSLIFTSQTLQFCLSSVMFLISNMTASLALVASWYRMLKSCYLQEFRSKCDILFYLSPNFNNISFILFCPQKLKALTAFMQLPFHSVCMHQCLCWGKILLCVRLSGTPVANVWLVVDAFL